MVEEKELERHGNRTSDTTLLNGDFKGIGYKGKAVSGVMYQVLGFLFFVFFLFPFLVNSRYYFWTALSCFVLPCLCLVLSHHLFFMLLSSSSNGQPFVNDPDEKGITVW